MTTETLAIPTLQATAVSSRQVVSKRNRGATFMGLRCPDAACDTSWATTYTGRAKLVTCPHCRTTYKALAPKRGAYDLV